MDRREFLWSAFCPFFDEIFGQNIGELKLKSLAKNRGLFFGSAISSSALKSDAIYAQLIADQCFVVTPEWEMKWHALSVNKCAYDFSRADLIVDYADKNNLLVRGHVLVWAKNIPFWLFREIETSDMGSVLKNHIQRVMNHFKGRVFQWDVVNEAIQTRDGRSDGLRNSVLLNKFGPGYIVDSFKLAKLADYSVPLFYNDYGFWGDTKEHESRRTSMLKLLEFLKRNDTPIDGVGLQSHLYAVREPFSEKKFDLFLRNISSFGVDIVLTELDVNDRDVSRFLSLGARDVLVADLARRYLDVALSNMSVKGVVVWGMADKYSYLNNFVKDNYRYNRRDGLINRALPYDVYYNKKALWYALAEAFSGAPKR